MHFTEYIYFFYGLAFFFFGFSILHYPTENSIFKFANRLKYLGAFGILHGISEWLVMFNLLDGGPYKWGLEVAGFVTMSLSYIILLVFALRVVSDRLRTLQIIGLIAIGMTVTLFLFQHFSFNNVNIIVRYFLALPGIFLTAYIFLHPVYIVQGTTYESIKPYTYTLAGTFIVYGIVAGLIVPAGSFFPSSVINTETFQTLTGLPVQLFRALCAIIAGIAIAKILHVFKDETDFHILKLSKALEESGDTVVITDIDGKIEYVNRAFEEQSGFSAHEAVDKKPSILRSGEHQNTFYEQLWQTILSGETYRGVLTNKRKDATFYHEFKTIVPIKNKNGKITNFISTGKDITSRIIFENELEKAAATDPLTGAANRLQFDRWLKSATDHSRDARSQLSLILFDIDDFKTINDTFGHAAGDEVLIKIANIVHSLIRSSDMFARWGGEEFVILQTDTPLDGTLSLAERIRKEIGQSAFGNIGNVTVSLGVTRYDWTESIESFVNKADYAMYQSKKEGKNRVSVATE